MKSRSDDRLIGRCAELARLTAMMTRADQGFGSIVVIDGEAGIGKTTVLDAAADVAVERGAMVLRGAADQVARRVPFRTIRSCLTVHPMAEPQPTGAARWLPVTTRSTAADFLQQEFAEAEGYLSQLDDWCSQQSVVLILDDLQWADVSSLLVLRRLSEFAQEIRLFVVLAVGPPPHDEVISTLLRELKHGHAQWLHLGPLTTPQIAVLSERIAGAALDDDLVVLLDQAGGNPLYAGELVRGLRAAGWLEIQNGVAGFANGSASDPRTVLPKSLTESVLRHVGALPEAVQRVLSAAATLRPGIEAFELATVVGVPVLDVWGALSSAVDAGLVVSTGCELSFRHELLRQVLAGTVDPATRSDLLIRAVGLSVSNHVPLERVAHYIAAADIPFDAELVNWMIGLPEASVAQAPEVAVWLLHRAIAAADLPDSERDLLRLRLIQALRWSGRLDEAEGAIRAVLDACPSHPPKPHHDMLRLILAQIYFVQNRPEVARELLDPALSDGSVTAEYLGAYQGFAALVRLFVDRFGEAEEYAQQAISLGEQSGDFYAASLGLLVVGLVRYIEGRLGEALEIGSRLITLYTTAMQGPSATANPFDPYVLSGYCLIELDRFAEAEETLRAAVALIQPGQPKYLTPSPTARARLRFLEGRWDDASADIETLLNLPDPLGYAVVSQSVSAIIAVHRGKTDNIQAMVPEPVQPIIDLTSQQLWPWAVALTEEQQGHYDAALHLLTDAVTDSTTEWTDPTMYYLYPDLARVASITGAFGVAEEVAVVAEATAEAVSTPGRQATAMLCRGVAGRSPELLAKAATEFHRAGRPLFEGYAYENLAVLLAADGRRTEARAAYAAAVDRFNALDARWDVGRTRSRLRELGLRVSRTIQRPVRGWSALTPTEQKVARLVASGLSNPEIAARMYLSRRTVQAHVSRILAKLQLRSRLQVATAFADLLASRDAGLTAEQDEH